VDKMLAYPLLWSKSNVTAAEKIENYALSATLAHFYFKGR
jgi:hypothetical protein